MPLLARLCTWWVLVVEVLHLVFVWLPRTHRFWFWSVLLHLGIGVFMGLYMFGLMVIIVNVAAFGRLGRHFK